jgi:gliding motility-associated-like protein
MKILKLLHYKQIFILFTIFCTQVSLAQLTVTAVPTDEECPGTGTLTLSVQNANPGYAVNYKVYLLPETNVPFWNSSNSYLEGLQDGDYLVKASQNIDGTTVMDQTQVTIGSNYVPLAFNISSVNAVCGNDGSMVINVTSGDPVQYEILDGPATAGPQSSNIFNGLPAGTYEVRVTDSCGNGYISTQTFYVEQPVLTIAGPNFTGGALSSCNQISVGCTVTAEGEGLGIVYPLWAEITVYPPGGGTPVVYNQSIPGGAENGLEITQQIQFYGAPHNIDFKITDPCGTVYTLNGSVIEEQMEASGSPQTVLCNETVLNISPQNYMPPYTINFTGAPAGFNPSTANSSYPGPFNEGAVFGTEQNPVPLGNYSFTITDACGRTATGQVQVQESLLPEPTVTGLNHDCINYLGSIIIEVPNHPLDTAVMTSAPSGYSQTSPYDVTNYIFDGKLTVTDLPIGNYTFTLTDICGNSYENVSAVVPEYTMQEPLYVLRPDCEPGKGALLITSNLTSVIITEAPAGFEHALPYDVSENIFDGVFSMDGLPGGTYTFKTSTLCIGDVVETVEIPAFEVTSSEIELGGDCVSFDLEVNYESNAENLVTFWLQAYNDEENSWMHPETGVLYEEGEVLNDGNAYKLENMAMNEALPYLGDFRVLKMHRSYTDGSTGENVKNCIEEFYEFFFFNELDIRGIYNLTCVGEVIDVQVDAVGVSPLHFELISKNGDPSFYVDNGENNIFTGLEGAMYMVRVTDPCGGYRVQQFNVSELPPLVSATTPADLGWCDMEGTGTGTFDLLSQNEIIIDDLDPDIVTITYHTSMGDAENDVNPISNPAAYTSGTAEIFARVEWNVNPLCYGLAQFKVLVTPPTPLAMQDKWAYCEGGSVTVIADPGYVSYSWSTGATTPSIDVNEPGTYTCTVISTTGCEISKTVEVAPILPPEITHVDIQDFNGDNNTITVYMDHTPNPDLYEYSIDGVNFQAGNVFTDIPAGQYTVIVQDRFNCGAMNNKDIHLLNYPKYFTPNGDGVNDKWRIPYAILEPNMVVYIYDRYGKPITSITATSDGWDGTLQGSQLPSTDYWFVAKRQDGREFRGHFAMMR